LVLRGVRRVDGEQGLDIVCGQARDFRPGDEWYLVRIRFRGPYSAEDLVHGRNPGDGACGRGCAKKAASLHGWNLQGSLSVLTSLSLAQMQVVRTGARPDRSIPQIVEYSAKSQLPAIGLG
jgi:hypothetical protein